MALAIDVIDRHDPSNEMHRQLQLKQAVLAVYITEKTFYLPFMTNKMKHFSFKSGYIVRVENGKIRCQLQPKTLK